MRITLALDYLIQCPNEDVIPAVQERLHGLLSHKSCAVLLSLIVNDRNRTFKRPHLRRRTLHAVRSLAGCDPSMLRWLSPDISRCIRDKDQTVVGSALAVCDSLHKVGLCCDVLGLCTVLRS